jgi:dephospho-CoA kinase
MKVINLRIIGLTGGIASGKSTVARGLQGLGAVIIDADQIAHQCIAPGQPAWHDIAANFGKNVLNDDDTINRAELGKMVFNDPARLDELNNITHPRIFAAFNKKLQEIKAKQPDTNVVLDVPLLFETGMDRLCDAIIVVWVDRETQIKRIMQRDGLSRGQAIIRIESQMSLDEKADKTEYVIDNTGSIEESIAMAANYYKQIVRSVESLHYYLDPE